MRREAFPWVRSGAMAGALLGLLIAFVLHMKGIDVENEGQGSAPPSRLRWGLDYSPAPQGGGPTAPTADAPELVNFTLC